MTPEPSKEEPKGVAPSKADLEKTKEITKGYFSPLIQEDEKPWKYFNEKIAQALAELRAEGERELQAMTKIASEKNSLAIDLLAEKSALEERVKALGEDCVQLQQTINCLEMDTVIPKLSEEITRLKAENEQYWALAKQHQEALKSSQKALGEMKLYHHNAKEEVHRLTSALAAAQDALESAREVLSYLGTLNSGKYHEIRIPDDDEPVLPQRKEWVDFIVPLNKKVFEKVNVLLSDPTGQAAFEKWKKMGAVVEAARACYEEDDFITENSPGSFERDKKLGEALEALDANGERE